MIGKYELYYFFDQQSPFPLLDKFKERFANLINNIQFKPNTNEFQKQIRKDISRIDKSKKL